MINNNMISNKRPVCVSGCGISDCRVLLSELQPEAEARHPGGENNVYIPNILFSIIRTQHWDLFHNSTWSCYTVSPLSFQVLAVSAQELSEPITDKRVESRSVAKVTPLDRCGELEHWREVVEKRIRSKTRRISKVTHTHTCAHTLTIKQ